MCYLGYSRKRQELLANSPWRLMKIHSQEHCRAQEVWPSAAPTAGCCSAAAPRLASIHSVCRPMQGICVARTNSLQIAFQPYSLLNSSQILSCSYQGPEDVAQVYTKEAWPSLLEGSRKPHWLWSKTWAYFSLGCFISSQVPLLPRVSHKDSSSNWTKQ